MLRLTTSGYVDLAASAILEAMAAAHVYNCMASADLWGADLWGADLWGVHYSRSIGQVQCPAGGRINNSDPDPTLINNSDPDPTLICFTKNHCLVHEDLTFVNISLKCLP